MQETGYETFSFCYDALTENVNYPARAAYLDGLVQKYKHAKTVTEKQQGNLDYTDLYDKRDYLNLTEWSVADVNGDLAQCGLSGSPTKVKAIQNIVFQAKESKTISGSDRDVEELIVELLANHTIG